MKYIEAAPRDEVMLLPACLDDYVPDDSPVRFLDEFAESLDLADCGFVFPKEDAKGRGRPAYHPKVLLKLYIYGYLNGIRSGRKLERSCHVNLEVIWLLQKLRPDFKTICDFRRKNAKAFVKVTSQFTRLCKGINLFSGELIAIDGSKMKGVNAPGKNWTARKLELHLRRVRKNIQEYLDLLAMLDDTPVDDDDQRREEIEEKLAHSQEKAEELEALQDRLESSGEKQVSLTDEDCRSMSKSGKTTVGYNVQTAVDSKHKLIAAAEVTNQVTDMGLLSPMAEKVKEELDLEQAVIVADKGYCSGSDLHDCEEMGLEPHVPSVNNSKPERQGLFGHDDFAYSEAEDLYICPNGEELRPQVRKHAKPETPHTYRNVRACRGCPIKSRCTTAAYRSINVGQYYASLKNTRERIKNDPEKVARRGGIVEHPFSCIKYHILPGGFNVRGLRMVRCEMALAQLAYNLKRVMKIMSLKDLIDACGAVWSGKIAIFRRWTLSKGIEILQMTA